MKRLGTFLFSCLCFATGIAVLLYDGIVRAARGVTGFAIDVLSEAASPPTAFAGHPMGVSARTAYLSTGIHRHAQNRLRIGPEDDDEDGDDPDDGGEGDDENAIRRC